jgi:hypothetical protein
VVVVLVAAVHFPISASALYVAANSKDPLRSAISHSLKAVPLPV